MVLSLGRRAGTEIFSLLFIFAYKSHNEKTPSGPPSLRAAKVILAVLLSLSSVHTQAGLVKLLLPGKNQLPSTCLEWPSQMKVLCHF